MRLRNKKTGEMIDLSKGSIKETCFGSKIQLQATDRYNKPIWIYNSLAELNEVWEDAPEEPKEWWYIDIHGPHEVTNNDEYYQQVKAASKEFGNYFESEEEAEKAVEKLKAITRLKKCGFKFEGYADRDRANGGDIVIYAHVDIPNNNLLEEAQPDMLKDLDLLFGGEE